MSNVRSKPVQPPGALVRGYRERAGLSLDDLADALKEAGSDRPSVAKLSRIENGLQPIPTDILVNLAKVMHVSVRALRPDLAAIFVKSRAA